MQHKGKVQKISSYQDINRSDKVRRIEIPKLFTHLSAHQPTPLQEVKSGENGKVVRHLGLLVNIVVLRLKAIGVEDVVDTQDAV